jgi:hypothetical protein
LKRLITVGAVLLLGLVLTVIEVNWIQNEKKNDTQPVVTLTRSIEAGSTIKKSDLTVKEIDKTLWSDGYVSKPEDVTGKTVLIGMESHSIITSGSLKENAYGLPETGNAITAIKLAPEEALCWTLATGEPVNVVLVDSTLVLRDLGEVTVKGLYDNYLMDSDVPVYVLVEGKRKTIENIVSHRESGQMELLKRGVEK